MIVEFQGKTPALGAGIAGLTLAPIGAGIAVAAATAGALWLFRKLKKGKKKAGKK